MADTDPNLHTFDCCGTKLAWWEWTPAAKGKAPSLLFAHATGFHGRVWDAVIEHFPDRHVLSLDLRGHGRSSGGPVDHWRVFAADTAELLEHAGVELALGIGHSMGAHTLLQVAADRPHSFAQLVLFDPVVVSPEFYAAETTPWDSREPHPTVKRKRHFTSPQEMFERFVARDPYALYDPRVLRDYCEYGLLEKADGEFELACTPEMEASVYMSSRSNGGIVEAARSVDFPVTVVRAKRLDFHDFKSSPTWPDLASALPQGRDLYRPDMTHFHPFQDPADAAWIIADAEGNGGRDRD
ncbi:alpha/beta fold hydrolase [Parerythrobacter aestuarii]|uniref:alpha/beta fold hydrolase n=1 Tax=Parerythrobacter aestuarii TaxID=3020909 RepID=UPI0024DE31BE|nr:alpha/beta hydrolase [Parerythrobacter aestuarii]